MKKEILLAALLVIGNCVAEAIPVKPGMKKTLTLSDGTTVVCERMGDEYLNWWQADDGTAYQLGEDNLYVAADLTALQDLAVPKRIADHDRRADRLSKARKAATIGGDHITYTGTKKGLIILVNFSDKSFATGHTANFYNKMANNIGNLTLYGFVGSIKDYFLSQSNDQFEVDFDIAGPVTVSQTYAYYGGNDSSGSDKRPGEMVYEALQLVDDDIDFSDYDWDGDGEVEQVVVLYAGPGEASGGDEDTIWPHESSLSNMVGKTLTLDGVTINTYACCNEIEYADSYYTVERVAGIGTICHEFSHCLGLADMYDILYSGYYGMSYWSIMDSGAYNGDSYCPANYTSFERIYCGWVEPIELSTATSVLNFPAWDSYPQPFIIYNSGNSDEYYLLENRQYEGWDESLYGAGMLILHVDFDETVWSYNYVNANANYSNLYNDHQRCTIFPADNNTTVSLAGLAGDPYPGTSGNASLTDSSTPASTLYNANASGTYYMSKPITSITQNDDGTIAFDFMGGSTTNLLYNAIESLVAESATNPDALVSVYDVAGRLVHTARAGQFSLNAVPASGVLIVKCGDSISKILK